MTTPETLTPKLGSRLTISFYSPQVDAIFNAMTSTDFSLFQKLTRSPLPHNWLILDHTLAAKANITVGTLVKKIAKYKKIDLLTPLTALHPKTQREQAKLVTLHQEVLGQKWLPSTKIYRISLDYLWTGDIVDDSNTLYTLKSYNNPISYEAVLKSIRAMTTTSPLFPDLVRV